MPIPSAPMPMWFADTDPRRGRATSTVVGALSALATGTLCSALGAATAGRARRRRAGPGRSG